MFFTPVASLRHWSIILLVALAFIFAPQFEYNDWERNTEGLHRGLNVYNNPDAVYPPWGIVLLWPYYFLTAPGSRIASVLVVGWLAARCRWSLVHFLAIVLSPFFIWTMLLSNMDILVLLLPVVLWEASRNSRWRVLGQMASLALLVIKPQGSFLLIGYWLWTHRASWRQLVLPCVVILALLAVTSLVGQPPLFLQWLDNLQHPSEDNQEFWANNNISMTSSLGVWQAVIVMGVTLVCVAAVWRGSSRKWTQNHSYVVLLLSAMLLSPYTSNQSVIAALAFVPSVLGVLLQYVIVFGGAVLDLYLQHDTWWTLLLGVGMLWFYKLPNQVSADES